MTDGDTTSHDARFAAWGAERSRLVTWLDPHATSALGATLSGYDLLCAMRDGEVPAPPIARLMNFRIVAVDRGQVQFACDVDESFYNPIGLVHGGLVCTLADTVLGCAVHSTLDAGVGYTSIDVAVSYLRPVTIASGELVATGVVTKPGRRVAFASAEILDAAGKPVATATGSCLVLEQRAATG